MVCFKEAVSELQTEMRSAGTQPQVRGEMSECCDGGWEGGRWVERTPWCVFGPTFPLTWKAGTKSKGGCFKNCSLITGSI